MGNELKIPQVFEVEVYSKLEPFPINPLHSLARVRIFYKGKNRNRTYLTDEFAEELLKTLPYTTVGAIYDEEEEDFGDHGKKKERGRSPIYGIVPENPNIAWEDHKDKDGVTRSYACADVILFTSKFEEASQILDKAQSMELLRSYTKGKWEIIDGLPYYVYTKGIFFGLQVLGDSVEPCFEGAQFYSLQEKVEDIVNEIKAYSLLITNGGNQNKMDEAIGTGIEGVTPEVVPEVNPDHALVIDRHLELDSQTVIEEGEGATVTTEDGQVLTVLETRTTVASEVNTQTYTDTETGHVSQDGQVEIGVNQETILRDENGQTIIVDDVVSQSQTIHVFEQKIVELEGVVTSQKQVIEAYELEISGLKEKVDTLEGEKATLATDNFNLSQKFESLTSENYLLNEYRNSNEMAKKKDLVDRYSKLIDKNTLDLYSGKLESYTFDSLKKDLATEYVDSHGAALFGESSTVDSYMAADSSFTPATELTGAAKLIANRRKVKN